MTEIERASMHSVTVDKAKLVEALRENRASHALAYGEALAGWREKVVALLADMRERILAGEEVDLEITLPKPEDHTEDYDGALANLEWSVHDQVDLSSRDFNQFVRDKWAWSAKFEVLRAGYTAR